MILKPINNNLESITIEDIENHKLISDNELIRDLNNIKKYKAEENINSFAGNPFLYHYQFKNLINCRRENGKTIYDLYNDKTEWDKIIKYTRKRNRGGKTAAGNLFECFRINLGSVVMFKATTAKYLYKKYKATHILDPTAGWGGRMLGAWALDIDYTGIDINIEMMPAYENMINFLNKQSNKSKLEMIWNDSLAVDFSKINYDFVLTSPPYINLELYEHMTPWESEEKFYVNFFIPLWDKCVTNIKRNGRVCFNISPQMYDDALNYGLKPCDEEEDLKQQLGQKMNKKKQDKIYIWKT
jgi:hypothetical protein